MRHVAPRYLHFITPNDDLYMGPDLDINFWLAFYVAMLPWNPLYNPSIAEGFLVSQPTKGFLVAGGFSPYPKFRP